MLVAQATDTRTSIGIDSTQDLVCMHEREEAHGGGAARILPDLAVAGLRKYV